MATSLCAHFFIGTILYYEGSRSALLPAQKKTRYGPGAVRLRWLENLTLFGPGGGGGESTRADFNFQDFSRYLSSAYEILPL